MTPQQPIRDYLEALAVQLRGLPPADADEVMREIESHILDAVDQAQARAERVDTVAMLAGFGPPEVLAAQYVAHLQHGAPPPAGFRVMQRMRHSVTWGLYLAMAAFGFSVALGLAALALAKLVEPSSVGVWSTAGGHTLAIAWSGPPYPDAQELLGYALIPIALMAALCCAELTRRVLRILRRGIA